MTVGMYRDTQDAHCRQPGCHCTHSDDCYRGWIDIKQDGKEYAVPCRTCRPAQRRITTEAPDRRAMQDRLQARAKSAQWTGA